MCAREKEEHQQTIQTLRKEIDTQQLAQGLAIHIA